jgi:hypothetical protein
MTRCSKHAEHAYRQSLTTCSGSSGDAEDAVGRPGCVRAAGSPPRLGRPRTHLLGRANLQEPPTLRGNARTAAPGSSATRSTHSPATTALASCPSRASRARPLGSRVAASWNPHEPSPGPPRAVPGLLPQRLPGTDRTVRPTVLGGIAQTSQGAHVLASEYGARSAKAGSPSTPLQPSGGTDADFDGNYRATRSPRCNAPS